MLPHQWLTTATGAGVDLGTVRLIEQLWLTGGDPNSDANHAEQEAAFQYYAESGRFADIDAFYPEPPRPSVNVRTRRPTMGGTVERWSWDSGYRTADPAYQGGYDAFVANRQARAEVWSHKGGNRPTVVLVHSWATGFFHLQREVYRVRSFFRSGLDVAIFILPFHGPRTPKQAWFGGQLFPSTSPAHANEAFGQAIWDLRGLVRALKHRGSPKVGVMGQSIGGYTVAMLANVEEQLDFCIPMIPVTSLADLMWTLGEGGAPRAAAEARGVTRERIEDVYRVHTPIAHPPKVDNDKLMIVAGRGDRVCRPDHVRLLWKHWNEPHIHWFPGGHMLHFGHRSVYKDVQRFIEGAVG